MLIDWDAEARKAQLSWSRPARRIDWGKAGQSVLGRAKGETAKALRRAGYDVDRLLAEQEAPKRGFFSKYVLGPLTYIPKYEAQLALGTPWTKAFKEAAKPESPTIGGVLTRKMPPGWKRTVAATAADIALDPTTYVGLYAAKGAATAARAAGGAAAKQGGRRVAGELAARKLVVSNVAREAAEGIATEAAQHGASSKIVQEAIKKSIGPAANAKADDLFLQKMAFLGDTTGRAVPKTSLQFGIGGAKATLIPAKTVQKIGVASKELIGRTPLLGDVARAFSTRYVRPAALRATVAGKAANIFDELDAVTAQATTETIVDSAHELLSRYGMTRRDYAEAVARIHGEFSKPERAALMDLINVSEVPLEARQANVAGLLDAIAKRKEKMLKAAPSARFDEAVERAIVDRAKEANFSPVEVVLAKFRPKHQADAIKFSEEIYPKIRAQSYLFKQIPRQAELLEAEVGRLGPQLARGRRVEDAMGQLLGPHPTRSIEEAVERLRAAPSSMSEAIRNEWRTAEAGLSELGAGLPGDPSTWRKTVLSWKPTQRGIDSPALRRILPPGSSVRWNPRVRGGVAWSSGPKKGIAEIGVQDNPMRVFITLLHEVAHLKFPGHGQAAERAADAYAIAEARRMGIDISKWDIDYVLVTAARVGETPRTSARPHQIWKGSEGIWRIRPIKAAPSAIPPRRPRAGGLVPLTKEVVLPEAVYKGRSLYTTRTVNGRKIPIMNPEVAPVYKELRALGATPEQVKTAFKELEAGWAGEGVEEMAAQLGLRPAGKVLKDASELSILQGVPRALAIARARDIPDTMEGLLEYMAKEPLGKMREDGLLEELSKAIIEAKLPGYQTYYIHGVPKGKAGVVARAGEPSPMRSLLPKTFEHNPVMREYFADVYDMEAKALLDAGYTQKAADLTALTKHVRPEPDLMKAVYDDLYTSISSNMRRDFTNRWLALGKTKKEIRNLPNVEDWVPIRDWKEFKGLYFPREANEAFQRMRSQIPSPEQLTSIAKLHSDVLSYWKTAAVAGPGGLRWIEGNFGGNIWLMFLAGVRNPVRVLQGIVAGRHAPELEALRGVAVPTAAPGTMGRGLDVLARGMGRLVPRKLYAPALGRKVGLDELQTLWREAGGMKTFTASEFPEDILAKTSLNPLSMQGFWMKGVKEFNSAGEQAAYMGLFADRLAKGDSLRDAVATTRRFLFDYGDLTEWERKYGKSIVPFYTWIRKNVALHFRMLYEQPGAPGAIAKFIKDSELNAPEYPSELKPSWMQEQGAIRGPEQGQPTYYLPQIPFLDISRVMSAKQFSGSLHPALQFGLKRVFGKDPYTGQDVSFRQAGMEALPWISTPARILRQPPEARQAAVGGLYRPWRPYRVDLTRQYQTLERQRGEILGRLARQAEAEGRMKATRARVSQRRRVARKLQQLGITEEMME